MGESDSGHPAPQTPVGNLTETMGFPWGPERGGRRERGAPPTPSKTRTSGPLQSCSIAGTSPRIPDPRQHALIRLYLSDVYEQERAREESGRSDRRANPPRGDLGCVELAPREPQIAAITLAAFKICNLQQSPSAADSNLPRRPGRRRTLVALSRARLVVQRTLRPTTSQPSRPSFHTYGFSGHEKETGSVANARDQTLPCRRSAGDPRRRPAARAPERAAAQPRLFSFSACLPPRHV